MNLFAVQRDRGIVRPFRARGVLPIFGEAERRAIELERRLHVTNFDDRDRALYRHSPPPRHSRYCSSMQFEPSIRECFDHTSEELFPVVSRNRMKSADPHPTLSRNQEREIGIAFSKTADADFVSVSGHASLEDDPTKKREPWNPMVQAGFPEGPESTDVAVIRVHANHADY